MLDNLKPGDEIILRDGNGQYRHPIFVIRKFKHNSLEFDAFQKDSNQLDDKMLFYNLGQLSNYWSIIKREND